MKEGKLCCTFHPLDGFIQWLKIKPPLPFPLLSTFTPLLLHLFPLPRHLPRPVPLAPPCIPLPPSAPLIPPTPLYFVAPL